VWKTVESIVAKLNQYPSLLPKGSGALSDDSLNGSDSGGAASKTTAPPQLSDFEVLSLRHQNSLEKVTAPSLLILQASAH
jgi:hypothetical protein